MISSYYNVAIVTEYLWSAFLRSAIENMSTINQSFIIQLLLLTLKIEEDVDLFRIFAPIPVISLEDYSVSYGVALGTLFPPTA